MHSKTFPLSHQKLAFFISVLFLFEFASFFVGGQPTFTEEPPSTLYVLSGKNATFNWKYFVVHRESTFDILSPKWSFYEENGTERVIGNDFRLDSWNWKIDFANCPPRLLRPTQRVFREENATLVITKATTADNGMYGCTLVLKSPPSVKSEKVHLIVTDIPQITKLDEIKRVLQNDNLTVTCSAIGSPTPIITWVRDTNNMVLASGNGSAVLKIYNITKDQSGKYVCQAKNNPNESPVIKETMVIVQYPVECNETLSNKSFEVCLRKEDVELKSVADGVPEPTHVWFLPNNKMVKSETSKESKYVIKVVKEEHIGKWTVNVTNGIRSHYCLNRIEIVQDKAPECKHRVCTPGEVVGFIIGLIIAVAIIVAITVVIYYKKKEKKKWKEWTTLEKALILLGAVVAIIIIIVVIVFIVEKCYSK